MLEPCIRKKMFVSRLDKIWQVDYCWHAVSHPHPPNTINQDKSIKLFLFFYKKTITS